MSARRDHLVREAKALAWPLVSFWASVLLSFGLFSVLLVLFGEIEDSEDVAALVGLGLATVIGVGAGQLLALLRVRTYVAVAAGTVLWSLTMLAAFAMALTPAGETGVMALIIMWFFVPFFLLCGMWSLRVHMGLLATWAPLVWLTGCVLLISEQTGSKSDWFGGDRLAIWDVFSIPFLLLGVALTLIFLASRELHRLHRWRFGPGGPDAPTVERKHSASRPTMGLGGLFLLTVLLFVLSAATGVVSPFLWNSVIAEDGEPVEGSEGDGDTDPEEGQGDAEPSEGTPEEGESSGQSPSEQIQEAAKQAGAAVIQLLLLVLLAIAGLFIFGPPTRRALLLRHLRKPLWPVPPTRRVEQAWRIVEIGLGDHGFLRQPGDTATTLVGRAKGSLDDTLDWVPLEQAADLADRVVYGLGMNGDDVDLAGRHADMAYESLQERLGERSRLWAWYRPL